MSAITENPQISVSQQAIAYADSAEGVFTISMFASSLLQLGAEGIKAASSTVLDPEKVLRWSQVFNSTAEALSVVRVIRLGISVPQDLVETSTKSLSSVINAVKGCSDILVAGSYAALRFTGSAALRTIGDSVSVVSDTLELAQEVQNLTAAQNHPRKTEDKFKDSLVETQKLQFLKICKAVATIAAGVLGAVALFVGVDLVSPLVLVVLSVVGNSLALASVAYKNNMQYAPLFEQPIQV